MLLSYEDAYYYKLLLQNGFYNDVNDFINDIANKNNTLEGIFLELVYNQNNLNELISCLHNYINYNKVNNELLCNKLKQFIKNKVDNNEITIEKASDALCGFAISSESYLEPYWSDFYHINILWDYVDAGILSEEEYKQAVREFIYTGKIFDIDNFWNKRAIKYEKKRRKSMDKTMSILSFITGIILIILSIILIFNIIEEKDYISLIIVILLLILSFLLILYFVKKIIIGNKKYLCNNNILICKRKDKILYKINKDEITDIIEYKNNSCSTLHRIKFKHKNKKYIIFITEENENTIQTFFESLEKKQKIDIWGLISVLFN